MPFRKSPNIARLEPSATLAVAARARELAAQGRDIVNLSAGEPDFDTPSFAADAGVDAIRAGRTRYTAAAGLPELRAAIAADLERTSGTSAAANGVVVTAGAKQALFNAIFALFGPGDRVLIPSPYWTSYPALVHLSRAEPVLLEGREKNGFKVTREDLDSADTGGVRGLILNSPVNPTGAVYTMEELEGIAAWAEENDVWLIGDQIYGRLCYTGERAPGLLDLGDSILDRAVVVDGASKLFAMTGWRIGFSYSRPDLASAMAAAQSHITSNATTPSQYAALEAYRGDPMERAPIREMLGRFRERRDLVTGLFDEMLPEVPYVRPDGAFYLFFRVDGCYGGEIDGSVALCARLLEEAGVALVPGAAFGDDRYVRLSYAAAEDTIREGVRRMQPVLATPAARSSG